MPFTTSEEFYAHFAAVLKRGGVSLTADAPHTRTMVTAGRTAAYQDIVTALALRGFSAAQIAAWDAGKVFELAIGTFWALDYTGCLGNFDDRMITKLDRREELKTVAVLNGGVLQHGERAEQPLIGYGTLSTVGDRFPKDVKW